MTAKKVLWDIAFCIYSVTTFWAKVRSLCTYIDLYNHRTGFTQRTNMLQRLWGWYWTKSRRDQLLETIDDSRLYEEWHAAAKELDRCMDYDIWYVPYILSPGHL